MTITPITKCPSCNKDVCLNIEIEEFYTKEEVEAKIASFISFMKKKHPELKHPLSGVGEWIKENLA